MLDLLNNAVAELDAGMQPDQRIEAALRRSLGETYRALSLWDVAETQWRKAIELEQAYAADTPEVAYAMSGLGQVLLDKGKLDDAAQSLQRALAIQLSTLPSDDVMVGDTINNLGLVADLRGDLKQAEEQYRRADHLREIEGADSYR